MEFNTVHEIDENDDGTEDHYEIPADEYAAEKLGDIAAAIEAQNELLARQNETLESICYAIGLISAAIRGENGQYDL